MTDDAGRRPDRNRQGERRTWTLPLFHTIGKRTDGRTKSPFCSADSAKRPAFDHEATSLEMTGKNACLTARPARHAQNVGSVRAGDA